MNFWQTLKKPIFILAPMEDVTDTVFRRIITQLRQPDVFFTEFTSVEGMFSKGDKKVNQRLLFTREEKPIVAQIWGLNPENFYKAAQKLSEMGFDGVDINMGCPEKNVIKKGACSGLIKNPQLASEIIQATKEGANGLPVSVKTRIGFKEIQTEEWIGFLLEQNLAAITIHGRTAAEMSKVPAHWEEIGKAVKLRNAMHRSEYKGVSIKYKGHEKRNNLNTLYNDLYTLIIGNGDVKSLKEAREKVEQYGVDGVMIGRGIFENPWLFNESVDIHKIPIEQRIQLLLDHMHMFINTWGKTKNFQILKKYFKMYISNFEGAQDLRIQLMTAKDREQVEKIISTESFLSFSQPLIPK